MKNFTLAIIATLTFHFTYGQTNPPANTAFKIDPISNCQIRYNYYPNLEAYFDNYKNEFIYFNKGEWIVAKELPTGYRGYSLFNKINVPITDYDDDNIIQFIKAHKLKYPYNTNGRKTKQVTASVN